MTALMKFLAGLLSAHCQRNEEPHNRKL